MTEQTPEALLAWLGKTETQTDQIDPTRLAQAASTFGLAEVPETLPPLWHLFFCNEMTPAHELAEDGHAKLGEFMPPVTRLGPFNRRMWAAGDIRFDGELRAGETVRRTSTIQNIALKEGRSGAMVFVDLERLIEGANGRVSEIRTVVYRHFDGSQSAPEDQPLPASEGQAVRETWQPDERELFRFSALTWNTHRIHYDRSFCQDVEAYPDILVHGPYTALKLATLAAEEGPLKRFLFRGRQPLFVNRSISLTAGPDGQSYEARNFAGHLAMTARVER